MGVHVTGIADLFRELEEEVQYHCEAQLELFVWRMNERKRENERARYRLVQSIDSRRLARNEYKRNLTKRRRRERRETDPEWLARTRAYGRAQKVRLRAQARAA